MTVLLLLISMICIAPESHYDIREVQEQLQRQHHEQELERFLSHLSIRESNGDWTIYNRWGYIGLYQFGAAAKRDVGYGHIRYWDFVNNPYVFPPEDQHEAVMRFIKLNIERMRPYTDKYYLLYYGIDEVTVGGIKITLSGMIAGAHLAGPGNMKRFIRSDGKINPRDALGTRLSDYVELFANYDIGFVVK